MFGTRIQFHWQTFFKNRNITRRSAFRRLLCILLVIGGLVSVSVAEAKPIQQDLYWSNVVGIKDQYFPTRDALAQAGCDAAIAYWNSTPNGQQYDTFTKESCTLLDIYHWQVCYAEVYRPTGYTQHLCSSKINIATRSGYICDNGAAVLDAAECKTAPPPEKNHGAPPPHMTQGTEPINLATGNVFETQSDYEGRGSFPLAFRRYYNSQTTRRASIGSNWRTFYDRRVKLAASGTEADVVRADGKVYQFSLSGGAWKSDPDVQGRLEQTADGWTYTDAEDTVEQYDSNGALQSITSRENYIQTLNYDSQGHLTTIMGPFGRVLTLTYDSEGRVATMTDPGGNTYTYSYDSVGNLNQVTYPDGATRQYLYEDSAFPQALTGIIDANGNRYLTWTYDSQGRATSDEFAGGADKVTLQYNSDGTTTETDASGRQRTFHFVTVHGTIYVASVDGGVCASCSGSLASATYDANGFLAT